MAYGQVNAPGVTAAELDAVKAIAQSAANEAAAAKTTANAAATAAGAAQADATAALNQLKEMLGGAMPSTTLASNTPEVIRAVASLGLGDHFWNVGDKIGIALNGTVAGLTLNATYYAFIIGFNHNRGLEGGNSIHFQFAKNASGKDICFVKDYLDDCDAHLNSGFYINPSGMSVGQSNYGGWRHSYMRKTICPAFLACMPATWRSVIAEITKYTDNTGGGTDDPSYVGPTADKIWLLSNFEVFGTRNWENSAEQLYQKQYAYYANGNSKIKYRHDQTGAAADWWLRSPEAGDYSDYFRCVTHSGVQGNYEAWYSFGFAPGFALA